MSHVVYPVHAKAGDHVSTVRYISDNLFYEDFNFAFIH